jgi:pyruvate/2-oxoglutarate/acetoin dehydrogenase E1 component
MLGEDICDPYGGAFKVTKGLSTIFPSQLKNMPISEAAMVGVATGMALAGKRTIVEVMFGDFCTLIADQVINHASKFRWMYNNQVSVPILIRTPMGGRRSYGPTHSQTLEQLFLGIPGLRIVATNSLIDPARTLLESLSQDDPVLLIENKIAYGRKMSPAPTHYQIELPTQPLAPIRIKPNSPADILMITYGGMDIMALKAMELLIKEEIWIDLIVMQQISPFIPFPLTPYRGLITCEEGTGAFGSRVILELSPKMPTYCVKALELPIPSNRILESEVLPDENTIVNAVYSLLGV